MEKTGKLEKRPFSIRDQIGYMLGESGVSFPYFLVESFFLVFCTYVLGLSAFYMSALFLVARLWDGINDPLIGSLPDRMRLGKSGEKFKPYIRAFLWFYGFSCVLCFFNVSNWGMTAKCIWAALVYLYFDLSNTFVAMPFGAVSSIITDVPSERIKLSRVRPIGATIMGFALSLVPQFIFDSSGNYIPKWFLYVGIAFGVLSILCLMTMTLLTEERIDLPAPPKKEKLHIRQTIKELSGNRPLIGLMIGGMGLMFMQTGAGQLQAYVLKEYFATPKAMTIVSWSNMAMMGVLFLLIPALTKRFKRKNLIVGACLLSACIAFYMLLVPVKNVYFFIVLVSLGMFSSNMFTMLIWSMVNDCIDYQEYTFGERRDGTIYSVFSLSRKVGATLASFAVTFGLGMIGFISGGAVQTPETVHGIYTLYCLCYLAVPLLMAAGVGLLYNLSDARADEMRSELHRRRQLGS